MKISIISGSHRQNSQSGKVARYIHRELQAGLVEESWLLDLGKTPFPLWDESIWNGDPQWEKTLAPARAQLTDSDAFVIVTPEWHGQVPAALKNFFLLFGKAELGHKPALIVAVSSGIGGAYPVAELRMSSYKNCRICYIPDHLIIREVETVLNDDDSKNDPKTDPWYRERIHWSLTILREYAIALAQVRASGVTESDKFGYGM